jgi:TolB-like protein/DNA-binding winged helix-turn-helix (wHTH) protein/tetratricopeptide (TPR) repeat protein
VSAHEGYRFGDFELDVSAYQLRRRGRRVPIERLPMTLLITLVRQRGRLIPRDELIEALWGSEVFVEVDTGLHAAVRKVRIALRDSAEAPRFVETVPGRGYRFIAHTEEGLPELMGAQAPPPAARPDPPPPEPVPAPAEESPIRASSPLPDSRPPRTHTTPLGIVTMTILGLACVAAVLALVRPSDSTVRLGVLPFENFTAQAALDVLAEGLALETASTLGRVGPGMQVVGHTSMQSYRASGKTLREIGRELNTAYLIEGALRAEGEIVRVTVTLIDTKDETQVWSQTYDRELTSLLRMQREVADTVAQQVRRTLSRHAAGELTASTGSPAAYDAFLTGLALSARRTVDANRQSKESFERAVQADPGLTQAWARLVFIDTASLLNADADPAVVAIETQEYLRRVHEGGGNHLDVRFAAAYRDWLVTWDWPRAEAGLREVVRQDPSHIDATRILGHLLSQQGRHREADEAMARARALDPLDPLSHALSAQVSFQARRFETALEHADRAIALAPGLWIGHMQRAQALEALGRHHEAGETLERTELLSGRNSKAVALRAYVMARNGQHDAARAVLEGLLALRQTRYVPPFTIAQVYLGLGEVEQVRAWLERAEQQRDAHLMYLAVDAKWDAVRGDPRVSAVLQRSGLLAGG